MKKATLGLLLVVSLGLVLLGGLGSTAIARAQTEPTFAPYLIPPQVPPPASPTVRALLRGSSVSSQDSWITVHLQGGPYQIGFQNGYLTAQGDDYNIQTFGAPADRAAYNDVTQQYIWPLIPAEYKQELRGIADGLQAAGYAQDSLWDVVTANAWTDWSCYATLLPSSSPAARTATASAVAKTLNERLSARFKRGTGCSAFIATGSATADGRPVMGHDTWFWYPGMFMFNVMYYVHPASGYDFSYQSAGGQIWSGLDWYENSAGLLLTETTLADSTYTPTGLPVFVRAREAAQYAATVAQAVHTLVTRNNGAYSNEWLIGDRTGRIASLQLGDKAYDLNQTRSGFFGSCNFDWGPNTRAEEAAADAGTAPGPYDPSEVCYARYIRWGQLRDKYWGRIDATIGMAMESDTFDSYLNKQLPDMRDLCGEPEFVTPDLSPWDGTGSEAAGAMDGKVTTETMALDGLRSYACWGRGSGDHFDASAWLTNNPDWADTYGPLYVFGLQTYSAQTTDRWVRLNGDAWHWR